MKSWGGEQRSVRFVAAGQEFGEYSLDLDTYRFKVVSCSGSANLEYSYTLTNPTPELAALLKLQNKSFTTQYISVEPDAFEAYCMKNPPFVLTAEIRKCLESKLWEFAFTPFSKIITIPFTQTYKILPHISYYITPLSLGSSFNCEIEEITTKQIVFKIIYGNYVYKETDLLKLHYSITGIHEA